MSIDNRAYLKIGERILLSRNKAGNDQEVYQITGRVGEGGSAICYEAVRNRNGHLEAGLLKEFYPADDIENNIVYSIFRLKNGQIVPGAGTLDRFVKMRDEYMDAYNLLNDKMLESEDNRLMGNFIQIPELLYGCLDEDVESPAVYDEVDIKALSEAIDGAVPTSGYIWTRGVVGQSYGEFIKEIKRNPESNSDFKLLQVIQTVIALTEGVMSIHVAGLLHLDIKPSNFMLPYREGQIVNEHTISMYDVNTLYMVGGEYLNPMGTDGFCAPEIVEMEDQPDNRADIYSIGAVLFNAIIVKDGIGNELYVDETYGEIRQLVKSSKLFTSGEAGTNEEFMSLIVTILEKCLAPYRGGRYEACEDLLDDLEKALEIITRINCNRIGQNETLQVVKLNEAGISDPVIAIQKMLYDHPIYESLEFGNTEPKILVIGSGTYGHIFIDQCLQAGQIKGYKLHITSISDKADKDKESYLQFRPELTRFVNVNGSIEKSRHDCMYADLVFRDLKDNDDTVRFTVIQDGASDENIDSIKHKNAVIINECLEPMLKEYDYVFVAAGNTETNRFIAETIAIEMLKENDKLCPVCYISEFSVDDDGTSNVYPVCINERITPETFSSDIDLVQMAFNADISWDNSLNKDMDEARDKFLNDRYRYESSLAFALSIRYKLYSIGIVLEKDAGTCNENAIVVKNLSEAANVFFEEILQKKDIDSEAGKCAKEKFDAVVALEHRRWVLEKVTAGWRAPRDKNGNLDLEQCVQKGKVKNELESTHPCIVYGTEETPLSTEEYNKYSESGREKWDVADIDPDLDELDLMSIKLHRCFRKRANEYKKNNPMQRESDIEKLRKLAEECGEDVSGAFRQYCFCLENILEGVENYTRQYSNYEKRLKKIFESSASEAVLKDAETRIALIKKAFFPVMEANLYRDYKSYDDVLVGKIPFILTYSFIEHVVVAFDESEEFNGRLNNVAAVTVLCPKKIDYIYYCDEHSDVDKVMTDLKAVLGYLDSREIHCQVRFVIAGSRECGTTNMLEKGLSGIESGKYQNVRFEGCTLLYCNPSQVAAYNEIVQYLQSDNCIYECSNLLFHDGKKYEAFKSVIKSAGIAYYSFDWRNNHFTKHNGCDYLQYIHDASFLTMENIAALKGTDSAISDIPEYQKDYEALWQIYESDKDAWRALCSCIDEYELRNKPLAQFEILGNECNEYTEKLSFVLPEYTEKTVRRLLRELSERDILRDDIIENYTSESYIVKFSVSKKYRHAFDTLFADPRILLDYYGVRAYNESKYVRVGYNNLEVADISRIEENSYRMLEKLQDKHFINGLRREDSSDKVSFAFTSPRIKRVMMKTNRVLLLRAYYETLKYGYHEPNRIAYFDDVVYGSKIGNQDESDALFITKGFRHIKITDMGEWSDEQLACIGDTLNEKLRENNQ